MFSVNFLCPEEVILLIIGLEEMLTRIHYPGLANVICFCKKEITQPGQVHFSSQLNQPGQVSHLPWEPTIIPTLGGNLLGKVKYEPFY